MEPSIKDSCLDREFHMEMASLKIRIVINIVDHLEKASLMGLEH